MHRELWINSKYIVDIIPNTVTPLKINIKQYEERLNKLQITISLRDEEINKFQKMMDNYEENILNIRREYEYKLSEKETYITNYTKEIHEKYTKPVKFYHLF